MNFKRLNTIAGWIVFAIATAVYMLSAERTGSLWDCGEFVSAAYKLEVVHPPGAPLFLMIGRMFAVVGEALGSTPSSIAYALNVMSGLCTSFLVLFVFWTTTVFAKISLVGRKGEPTGMGEIVAILGAGAVAGLATTFATSIWFSAVEGEVYALSGFFTGLVVWAGSRWYASDHPKADRWLVFIAYMIGLSIGVHLLSLLAIPYVAMLYFFKKFPSEERKIVRIKKDKEGREYKAETTSTTFPFVGSMAAFLAGFAILILVNYIIVPKLPQIAASFDYIFVNSFGFGLGSGVLFFLLLIIAAITYGFILANAKKMYHVQMALMMFTMVLIGFSTYGTVVIRANANPPINMNNPGDSYSLLSYINREQYGDRPLFFGPHFMAQRCKSKKDCAEGKGYRITKEVYRPVLDKKTKKYVYKPVDEKAELIYRDQDYMFLPRLGHMDRGNQYRNWLGPMDGKSGPSWGQNMEFLFSYQMGWMYGRYFAWNFIGRQNAQQGVYSSDLKKGNWLSGVGFVDSRRLYKQSELPKSISEDKGRNTYYFIPFILGLIGLFFHFTKSPKEALGVMVLFLMTGLAIIFFANQPPQEPRERDYVLAGSIFTFCIWIGMSVPAIYSGLKGVAGKSVAALVGFALAIPAPIIMGYQNWDDHSRAHHSGARDYATNFLESCAENAIVFTYGDNDTYPLWYAQEVEGIRTDVRVVNFSLLAVDWYIDQLRRKINESDAIEMTISRDAYQGKSRNYIPIYPSQKGRVVPLADVIQHISESHPLQQFESFANADAISIPINKEEIRANKVVPDSFPDSLIVNNIQFQIEKQFLVKDEIALLDIISTNAKNGWKRPIYFAVTCRPEKIMGFKDYLQLEGMTLRIVPIKTPSPKHSAMMMGRTESDLMYDNMMNKFAWGNFDKQSLFVDESYMPSVHSLQYGFMRLAEELVRRGEKERGQEVMKQYFESFPHMNFAYDKNRMVLQAMDMCYRQLDMEDYVKQHVETMADAIEDNMNFYTTLTDRTEVMAFYDELDLEGTMMVGLIDLSTKGKKPDEALTQGLKDRFVPLMTDLIQQLMDQINEYNLDIEELSAQMSKLRKKDRKHLEYRRKSMEEGKNRLGQLLQKYNALFGQYLPQQQQLDN